MKRILFVDDKPSILNELQQALRSQQDKWEMAFALGGESVLALMEANPFDVVVSDMQMPGMDGATLLKIVRDQCPDTVRIVLGGRSDIESALRAAPVAHQFLLKPCDLTALRVAIGRATNLSEALNAKLVAKIVGSIQQLPALPRTYSALQKALTDPGTSLDEIASIVEQDVTIAAKILQLANSTLFGARQTIATVHTAVSYLGVNILQQLTLSAEVFHLFKDSEKIEGFSLEELYSHSQLTARIAGAMRASDLLPEAPVVAGLLHDVGKLVLATRIPGEFARLLAIAKEQQRPLYEVEQEAWGLSHAEIGAYLLGLWGLPCVVVEAVAHHHTPNKELHEKLDTVTGLHLANILAHEHPIEPSASPVLAHSPIDLEYLAMLGVADRLTEWEAAAEEAARELAIQ